MGDVKIRRTPCIVLPTREYRLPVAYFCLCWRHQPLYLQVLIKMICTSRRNISRNVKSSMFFSPIFSRGFELKFHAHTLAALICDILWGQILKTNQPRKRPVFLSKATSIYIYIYTYICIYMDIHIYIYICNYVRVFQFNHFYNTIFSCKSKIKDTFNIRSFRLPYVFPPCKGCLVFSGDAPMNLAVLSQNTSMLDVLYLGPENPPVQQRWIHPEVYKLRFLDKMLASTKWSYIKTMEHQCIKYQRFR